jgi:magnesium transporter
MNFEYMPELGHPWGYAITWGVMVGVGVGMLVYFWRKAWL